MARERPVADKGARVGRGKPAGLAGRKVVPGRLRIGRVADPAISAGARPGWTRMVSWQLPEIGKVRLRPARKESRAIHWSSKRLNRRLVARTARRAGRE